MQLIIVAAVIWVVSQSIKFLLFLFKGGKISLSSFCRIYIWIGKFPSSHTALLTGVIYTIWLKEGVSLLFGFSVVCAAIFIFTLWENKKRYELLKEYLIQSQDQSIKNIILDGKLDEFEGHTALEIVAGSILGFAVAAFMGIYF